MLAEPLAIAFVRQFLDLRPQGCTQALLQPGFSNSKSRPSFAWTALIFLGFAPWFALSFLQFLAEITSPLFDPHALQGT